MDTDSFKTTFTRKEDVERDWFVVDATNEVVGRLASQIAPILRGKHKPEFTPHVDVGDFVIVVNADKVVFTGSKLDQKEYTRYSGYQGGLTRTTARTMMRRHPERVVESAVWGMLPKNRLGRKIIRRLKVYAGDAHPHQAQRPKTLEV
jgi:large subunit ribosomal protein L13